jgi:hypothetical protein
MHLQPGVGRERTGRHHRPCIVVGSRSTEEIAVPELTVPEVRLSDIKLPDVDISKMEMPKVDFSKVDMPKIDLSKVELPKIDLSKIELPKVGREERGGFPFLPIAAFLAVIAAIGAALWLVSSPTATARVRESADRTWRKVTRQATDVIRYDEDDDLASLLPNPDQTRPTGEEEAWPDTFAELGESVSVTPKSTTDQPAV